MSKRKAAHGDSGGTDEDESQKMRPRGKPKLRHGERYGTRRVAASSFRSTAEADRSLTGGWAFTAARDRQGMRDNLPTTDGSANADLSRDLPKMRRRSRALCRNNALVAGAVETMVSNVIGTGLQFQSQVDADYLGLTDAQADQWQRNAERLLAHWSRHCDASGRLDFSGMQQLCLRSMLQNGDEWVLRREKDRGKASPFRLALQFIEADRVSNPTGRLEGVVLEDGRYMTHGVEVGPYGDHVAIHVSRRHPGDILATPGDWERIPMRGEASGEWMALQIGRVDRVGQSRGIPFVSSVLEAMHMVSELGRAHLTREQVQNLFTAFVVTDDAVSRGLGPEEETDPDANRPQDYKLGPGAILDLARNEEVIFAEPKGQGAQFDAFVTAYLRQVGPALGLPYEVLVQHFQSSYSAARAALLQAWKTFKMRRQLIVSCFCRPAVEAFFLECVLGGHLVAPGFVDDPLVRDGYCRGAWIGPSQGHIDEEKAVRAAKLRVELGVSTLDEETAALTGGDWEAKHPQRVKEVRKRREGGLDVEPVTERARPDGEAPGANARPATRDQAEPDDEDEQEAVEK